VENTSKLWLTLNDGPHRVVSSNQKVVESWHQKRNVAKIAHDPSGALGVSFGEILQVV